MERSTVKFTLHSNKDNDEAVAEMQKDENRGIPAPLYKRPKRARVARFVKVFT